MKTLKRMLPELKLEEERLSPETLDKLVVTGGDFESDRSDSHLVLGVAYAQAGLLNEAGRELRAAAEENPGNAVVANLLASVNRMEVNPAQRQSK